MNEELKQILIGILIFGGIIAGVMFYRSGSNERDLTSPDNYYNSGQGIDRVE